ncbi:MAG: exopolysaccharide biosynthesis polyprenyl glycosylphosphotransferase [Acidimicrobiia bacterium]
MKRAAFLRGLWIADLAWLAVAILIATFRVFGVLMPWLATTPTGTLMPSVGLTVGGALIAMFITYRSGEGTIPRPSYGQAIAIVGTTMTVTAVGLVISREYFSREWLLVTFVLWAAQMLAHRTLLRMRPWSESMVVVTQEKTLADGINESPHATVIATVAPDSDPSLIPLADDMTLVIDLRATMSDEMARFVSSASISGQRVVPLVAVYEEYTGRLPLVHILRGWEISRPVARSRYAPFKRVLDATLTVVTAPIWLLIGAFVWSAVRMESDGAAIYRQTRVGKNGKLFTLLKFRTMVVDAEALGPQFAQQNDPRLTRIGRFLRRSRLDEIPQLWNVLKGDLAIVGPRPERPVFVETFTRAIPFYDSRHLVRPGITGWAQVHRGYGGGIDDALDKLTYDLYYVKHSSLWLDTQILGKTVWIVVTGKGSR